jgi:hypothetical protein
MLVVAGGCAGPKAGLVGLQALMMLPQSVGL